MCCVCYEVEVVVIFAIEQIFAKEMCAPRAALSTIFSYNTGVHGVLAIL